MISVGFLQLDVADTLCVGTTAYCVFMVVDKFITVNACTMECLEEGVNRAVANAYDIAFCSVNVNCTFKAAVYAAVCFGKFGKAMTQQFVVSHEIDIFLLEQVNDLVLAKFVAVFICCHFNNIAKFRMHFFRQVVANCVLQDKRCTAFAGLAVNADNRLVLAV